MQKASTCAVNAQIPVQKQCGQLQLIVQVCVEIMRGNDRIKQQQAI